MTMLSESLCPTGAVAFADGVAPTRQAGAASMISAWNQIIAAQRVSLRAVRFPLVGKATLLGCVQKVLPLGSDKQVRGIHAYPVVAVMADDATSRDRPVVQYPRKAVDDAIVPTDPETTIAVRARRTRPLPAAIGLPNLSPKTGGGFLRRFGARRMNVHSTGA
jgi:hypothetical protein